MYNNNIGSGDDSILTRVLKVNEQTGEVVGSKDYDGRTRVSSEGQINYLLEQSYKKKRQTGKEFVTVKTSEKNREIILTLSHIEAGLLMLLGLHIDYATGVVCEHRYTMKIPMMISSVEDTAPVSRVVFQKTLNELRDKGIVHNLSKTEVEALGYNVADAGSNKATFLRVDNAVIFKGPWKENGIKFIGDQYRANTSVIIPGIGTSLSLKGLGLLLKIGLFLHKDYNVLVTNPEETDVQNLDYITERGLMQLIGASKKALSDLLIRLEDLVDSNAVMVTLSGRASFIRSETGKHRKVTLIYVNPDYLVRGTGEPKAIGDLIVMAPL